MTQTTQDVTAAELAILEKLWEYETASLKQISHWLYGSQSPAKIATVQKLISRLEAKGIVERDRTSWPHQFHAMVQRDQLIALRLQATADALCDGMMSTLLTHLVRSVKLNPRQWKRLRKVLDDLEIERVNES